MKDRKSQKQPVAHDEVQLVTFQVGAEEYGLPIHVISEVIRPHKITALPKMPAFVEGVINLRGTIIPVVDLRRRFELPAERPEPRKMRMIITRGAVQAHGAGLLGLVVDGVKDVLEVDRKDIDTTPPAATGRNAEFISGMAKLGDRLIILLEIARILSSQESLALAEAGNA